MALASESNGSDQVPGLGRFLFEDWLQVEAVTPVSDGSVTTLAAAAHADPISARHQRAIKISDNSMTCCDTISGDFKLACLRRRLALSDWPVEGAVIHNGTNSLCIEIDGMPIPPTLNSTFESHFYLHKAEIPEFSVEVSRPGTFVTKVTL